MHQGGVPPVSLHAIEYCCLVLVAFFFGATDLSFVDYDAVPPSVGCTPPHYMWYVCHLGSGSFSRACANLDFCLQVLHLNLQVGDFLGDCLNIGILRGELVCVLHNL